MKTHLVIFTGKLEPVYVNKEQGEAIIRAKQEGIGESITIAGSMYDLRSIKAVKVLEKQFVGSWDICRNEQCSSPNRIHSLGAHCDYDMTGSCVVCAKQMWERDKSYSLKMFKRMVCKEHCGDQFWSLSEDDRQNRGQQVLDIYKTQKPHQSDEVPTVSSRDVEPVYQRPEEEVKAEEDWIGEHRIEDIPL